MSADHLRQEEEHASLLTTSPQSSVHNTAAEKHEEALSSPLPTDTPSSPDHPTGISNCRWRCRRNKSSSSCLRRCVRGTIRVLLFIGLIALAVIHLPLLYHKTDSDPSPNPISTTVNKGIDITSDTDDLGHHHHRPVYKLHTKILNTISMRFVRFPDRLQQAINVTYVHRLLDRINEDERLEKPLQPLDRAFVRIITPAEFAVLSDQGVTIEQINDVATNHYIVYTQYTIKCLALTKENDDVAAYLRVYSRQWEAMRDDIADIFYNLGGDPNAFQPRDYHPHLTVGHTNPGALHDADVALNDEHCWAKIKLVGSRW